MEGSGAAHAAHLSGRLDALVIRGISDRADPGKHAADASGSQERAAAQAATVAVAVLRKQRPRGSGDSREGLQPAPAYGGDHLDFRNSTFHGPFVAKRVERDDGER
ncbi:hypothetical protein GCM10020295_24790 [Streptomyces cinereospinus]